MKKLIATGVAAASLAAGAAWAEYPNDKPITFVIPYSPGGGFDTIVRQMAPALEKAMGTTVVPENISDGFRERIGGQGARGDDGGDGGERSSLLPDHLDPGMVFLDPLQAFGTAHLRHLQVKDTG